MIGFPSNLAEKAATQVESLKQVYPLASSVYPAEEDLIRLTDMLNHYRRITLFCGIGRREAHGEIIRMSGILNAPITYTFKGKMEVQYDNPYGVSTTGLLSMPSNYYSMREAKVLVVLETDFLYSAFLPDDVKVVQVDIKPERLGRRTKVNLGFCGGIRSILHVLLPMLQQKKGDLFLCKQLKHYERVERDLTTYTEDKGKIDQIHSEYVMPEINKISSGDTICTVDTDMTCIWGVRYLQTIKKRHMLSSPNHGSMANILPQVIGAASACPDRQAIALCGDGELSITLGDLEIVVQYKLPVKMIVFSNRSLGMVKLEVEVDGLSDWQTNMLNPNFAQITEAVGMTGFNISDPEEVLSTLCNTFELEDPVLANIMTDPDALAMPPKIELGQMVGSAQSVYKLPINGRSQEVIDTVNSNFKYIRGIF